MESIDFRYVPTCSAAGCDQAASYKIAAPWSSGASSELKNYGLACPQHREAQLTRARRNRAAIVAAEDETLGDVGVYLLSTGSLDTSLTRLPDHDSA